MSCEFAFGSEEFVMGGIGGLGLLWLHSCNT